MKINLISTGQLGDGGQLSTFGETWWKVTKGSMVIAKGDRIGTLYLCPHNTDYSMYVASTKTGASRETGAVLWHHRLGHMSEKGMQIIHSRKLLPNLKQVSLEFCENCVYGKQKRVRFLRVGNKRRVKSQSSSIQMYGDQLRYNLLVPLVIMLLLLMMQLEKLGFIALHKNLMILILLRSGKIWLRMR